MFIRHNRRTSLNWPYVYFARRLECLIKKLPVPTTQATNIFIQVKSCNALLRILLLRIRSYLKLILRYIFLKILYTYHPDSQYLRTQECKDPWLLFASKGAREQKRLENTATMHTLLAPMLTVNTTKPQLKGSFLSPHRPQYAMNCYVTLK